MLGERPYVGNMYRQDPVSSIGVEADAHRVVEILGIRRIDGDDEFHR